MANLLQRLFDGSIEERLTEATSAVNRANTEIYSLQFEREQLQESVRDLSLYLEDLGWIPVDGWEEDRGFSLKVIQEQADNLRALLTVNPTIKKAINARYGYIWSRGVTFTGSSVKKVVDNKHNSNVIFDDTAHWKLEAQLATDGNIWAARNKNSEEITLVPINQLGGWVVDENDPTRVLYWLREYTIVTKNFNTGIEDTKHIKVFYPDHGNTTGTARSIDGIKIDRNVEMVHLAANRQEGWILGIPDILAAMFWAKNHKELFEAGSAYVKAQGKFASKVVSKSQAGANRTAAALASAPRRDPETGEVLEYGGTAIMSAGLDVQLMGKMSGGVDFDAFDPVAGLIAVGLGVPLRVILGTSDGEGVTLEDTTVNEMRGRQQLWSWFFKALFGTRKVNVVWPKIKTEPEYRRVQSIEISNKTNVLTREELRGLTLEAYGISGDPSDLPPISEHPEVQIAKAIGKITTDNAIKTAASTPEQGVDAGIGKLSNGADAKDARDNDADPNVKSQ